ncbi:MAG: hypothetical protein ABSF43_04590 [Rectinemataceae bacterium]|jgi:hypothetical protein
MKAPTDEEMKVRIGQSKAYSIVILRKTAKFARGFPGSTLP